MMCPNCTSAGPCAYHDWMYTTPGDMLAVERAGKPADLLTRKERGDVEYWRAVSAGARRVDIASRALLAIIDRIAPPPVGQGGK